ncbi:TerD family protein [Spirulina subsalsa FACHB-351]|uniref:TerD family protein n=1 Tax=Spirulina subsalsa FACHB-351 TaxID=234711 RepID=A0ABT3L1A9_9CYAN|nr:TerD family protein [Spirulina subsalsa]MCW6035287.1 TerD family protein [Spirulina subsalsa FACHB-351]
MAINLQKGQRISLTKESPGLTQVMCGLGWDVQQGGGLFGLFKNTPDFDLDASIICLSQGDRFVNKQDLVYYANLRHASGAIVHLGDNLTGEGQGDDEQILVNLAKIPNSIVKLVFTVNIYKCRERKQDFGQVKNAFVRLVNSKNQQEVARYNLSGSEYQGMTGLILAELERREQDWGMTAVGKGINVDGLGELVALYQRSR